jgi:YVTN family beta-propeller protein
MLTVMPFLNNNSFSPTEAKAESEYGMDNYKKYKDSSNVEEIIECSNTNVNNNGFNGVLDDTLPKALKGLATNDGAQTSDEGEGGASSYGRDRGGPSGSDSDSSVVCISNNNNVVIKEPPPPIEAATLSINKEWFACNNDDTDCTIQVPEQQISFQRPISTMYTQCTSNGQCPFANNAGFNIRINGTSPTPNTIPAQVNTEQQVEIGAGPFSVTEELFSDRLVPNASFDVENVPVQDIVFNFQRHFIDFDENGQRVFTANTLSNSISIIDLTNSNNVTNVRLAPTGVIFPNAVVFDDAGQRVFTPNLISDSVSIVDLANSNNVTNVPLLSSGGNGPRTIAFDAAGHRVFTANVDSSSVSIIDLDNSNNVTNVPLVGGRFPVAIVFDAAGARVFTANLLSSSVSIVDLANSNNVTNVPLAGGIEPEAIAFDTAGHRVFTANAASDSVSIIDLANSNNVTNVPLGLGGDGPVAIAFDETGQRVFTANVNSHTISIIDLANSNTVTNVPLAPSGGIGPLAIAFDAAGQRVFTANTFSDSVSIISKPTVAKICHDSGFDTGDIRTFVSGQQTLEQITCINFVGECSGEIEGGGETRECTVQDYAVSVNPTTNGD